MGFRYNLRSRSRNTNVDPDIQQIDGILNDLKSKNFEMDYNSSASSDYSMNSELWDDEKSDEDIVREACSCISRHLDPPERFFELLRMYDGGELSDEFVKWMSDIPTILRYMNNKKYRQSFASKEKTRRERSENRARTHPLIRTKSIAGFSTNLIQLGDDYVRSKKRTYNLRSLNAVTTIHTNAKSTSSGKGIDK